MSLTDRLAAQIVRRVKARIQNDDEGRIRKSSQLLNFGAAFRGVRAGSVLAETGDFVPDGPERINQPVAFRVDGAVCA
jgi:hypothetical protein